MGYCKRHGVDHLILEVQSPGGSLFEANKIMGLMKQWHVQGKIVETRCYGFALSAGFLVFASGTPGYRKAAGSAELMWHELSVLT